MCQFENSPNTLPSPTRKSFAQLSLLASQTIVLNWPIAAGTLDCVTTAAISGTPDVLANVAATAARDPDRPYAHALSGKHHRRNFIAFTKAVHSFSRDTTFDPRKRGLRASATARVTAQAGCCCPSPASTGCGERHKCTGHWKVGEIALARTYSIRSASRNG
jgi:hypothetical protein